MYRARGLHLFGPGASTGLSVGRGAAFVLGRVAPPWLMFGAAGIAGAAGGCRSERVQPPPPVVAEEEAAALPIALPPSFISAPITFDLRPVLAELEAAIPKRIGSIERDARVRVGTSPTVWLAAELERGPLQFAFGDSTVSINAVFRYRGRAWVRTLLAAPSFSCGLQGLRPRMGVGIHTTWGINPDWHLRTRSRVTTVEPVTRGERDQCEVSFLNIDVTGKVADAARRGLSNALRNADAGLARLHLEEPAGVLWRTIQKPISIAGGRFWLVIRPEAISLGNITARDSTLTTRLSMRASQQIISGRRPPDGKTALPSLEREPGIDSVLVYMEGLLRYAVANRILAEQLTGRSVRMGWRRVRIDRVQAMHGGAGRVILAIDLRGRARGRVYVVGTPTYDATTDLITIPDLAFDVNSESHIDRTLGWFASGPFLGRIRDNVKIPATALLDLAVRLANEEIERELEDGVWLRGDVGSARTVQVHATRDGIVARALGAGRLRLDIRMQNLVPPIPDPITRLRPGGA